MGSVAAPTEQAHLAQPSQCGHKDDSVSDACKKSKYSDPERANGIDSKEDNDNDMGDGKGGDGDGDLFNESTDGGRSDSDANQCMSGNYERTIPQ